jgi:hypothetical protein
MSWAALLSCVCAAGRALRIGTADIGSFFIDLNSLHAGRAGRPRQGNERNVVDPKPEASVLP